MLCSSVFLGFFTQSIPEPCKVVDEHFFYFCPIQAVLLNGLCRSKIVENTQIIYHYSNDMQ